MGRRYPAIGQAWRRAWEYVAVRARGRGVEALHRSLRKIIKTRGSFPNDDAALKLLYLVIRNAGLRYCAGGEPSSGPPPWASFPSRSAIAFREQHDDENRRHHDSADDRSVRTFALKRRRTLTQVGLIIG